jgi:Ca2+-binding RTX toxin-like protein
MATINGTSGGDNLKGTTGDDTIWGLGGNDVIDGGAGNDTIEGGIGNDTLRGGNGTDTFKFNLGDGKDIVSDLAAGETVQIGGYASAQSITQVGGSVVVVLSGTDQITFQNMTVATVQSALQFGGGATSGDDTLVGTSADNTISGLAGNDTISGLGGDDTLAGNDGNDTLAGGDGADTIDGGDGFDIIYSDNASPAFNDYYSAPLLDRGSEVDTITGGAGNDAIFAGYGDNVDGGPNDYYGGDTLYISFQGATSGISFDLNLDTQVIGGGTITGIESVGWVEGSDYGDYVDLNAGYTEVGSSIFGMGGDDTLVGGYGTYVLDGGDGNDTVDGRACYYLARVDGGAGDDTLYTNLNSNGAANGGDGNDTIYANADVHGGNGDDTIYAVDGYYSGTVHGDAGNDTIYGRNGGDPLLDGGDGDDTIDGGTGDDTIQGGAGNDVLTGGDGNDKFIVGDGNDVITDFSAGDSLIVQQAFAAQSMNQVGADVVIDLPNGSQVTLQNSDVATVRAAMHFSEPQANDIALSADGSKVYATDESGNLNIYNSETGVLLNSWHVGTNLGGMDISPDGTFAIITELQPVATIPGPGPYDYPTFEIAVYKVDLASGAVTDFNYTTTGFDYSFYDAAILPNGKVLLTEAGYGGYSSGWGTMKLLDLSTGQYSQASDQITSDSVLTKSGSTVLVGEVDISDARTDVYTAGSGVTAVHQYYADGVQGFNQGVQAISSQAGLVAQSVGQDIYIYNTQLQYKFDLGQIHPELSTGTAGLTFDSTGQYLFLLNTEARAIYMVSTSDWSIVGEYSVGANMNGQLGTIDGDFGNRLLVAPDMSYFIVQTDDGIVRVDPTAPPPATNGDDTIVGTSGNDTIDGLAGNDLIMGQAGDDIINGSAGDDTLAGGGGSDTLNGGDGNDTVYSGDVIFPDYSTGRDTYALDRGTEADTLNGGEGNDVIYAGYGDNVDGGNGRDALYVSFQGATGGITFDANLETQVIGAGTITSIEKFAWIEGSNFADNINAATPTYVYGDYGTIFGMGGSDTITAGAYTAWIDGGDGSDVLDGRNSITYLEIDGGAGDDTIYANPNSYSVAHGGDGNDTIYANGEAYGEAGDDTISLTNGGYANGNVQGGAGNDVITGASTDDRLLGNSGADTIDGGAGDDTMASGDIDFNNPWNVVPDMGAEHDVLSGGDGSDHLSIGYGDDADGGSGTDYLQLSLGGASVGVTLNSGSLTSGLPLTIGGGTIQNIEVLTYLRGSEFADHLTVAAQPTAIAIDGGGGDDFIAVNGGDSVSVDGGDGNDRIDVYGGTVTVNGGNGDDEIWAEGGPLTAFGWDGDDEFVSGADADVFYGNEGSDTVAYFLSTSGVTVNFLTGVAPGGDQLSEIENIAGSNYADYLTGDSGANTLDGAGGDDTLSGGVGADTLSGGAGNDTFLFKTGDGSDTITDFAAGDVAKVSGYSSAQSITQVGSDVVAVFASGDQITFDNTTVSTVQAGLKFDVQPPINLVGTSGNDTLTGGTGNDTLNGAGGNDILDGKAGADTMTGGAGNDTFYVDNAGDLVKELSAQGTDTVHATISYTLGANVENGTLDGAATIDLTGNALVNKLLGNDGDNFLYGMAGADTLIGGGGNDTLRGGIGADTLTGGAGADIFLFENGGGNDKVTDFQSGLDKLDFHLLSGVTAADVTATLSRGNELIKVDVNHDGRADFTITLVGVTSVDASDYIFG